MTTVGLIGFDDRSVELSLRTAGFTLVGMAAAPGDSGAVVAPVPDVVVIDMRREPSVPPLVSALHLQHPGVRVVLVARTLDTTTLLDAMRAGASEVVPAGFTATTLVAAIRRLTASALTTAGSVVAFAGAKGGQGTTTIAVNVAAVLAESERTLLVDLHPAGGHAALCFDAHPAHTIIDALENTQRLDDAFLQGIVATVGPNLDLLAAPETTVRQTFAPASLQTVLQFVTSQYARVVIDLAAQDLDMLTLFECLDRLVIVTTQELPALRDAARLLKASRATYGDRVVVALNRFDRRAEITLPDVERTLGMSVAHVFPSAYRRAQEAQNAGRPLVLGSACALTDALKDFTHGLVGRQDAPPHAGLLGRLMHAGA